MVHLDSHSVSEPTQQQAVKLERSYSTASLPIRPGHTTTEYSAHPRSAAFVAMTIDHPQQGVKLPSIHDLLSDGPDDSRRSSTSSYSSTDSDSSGQQVAPRPLQQLYDQMNSQDPLHHHHRQKRALQPHYHPYPDLPTPAPSSISSPIDSSTRKSTKTRKWTKARRSERGVRKSPSIAGESSERNAKAEREAANRTDSAFAYAFLQREVFKINPNMPQLGVPLPDKVALTPLKSNNIREEIRRPDLEPLLYNKSEMLNLSTAAHRDSRLLFERTIQYLENIDQPGALPPKEAAQAIAFAVAHRGCVNFALPKFLKHRRSNL